MFHEEANNQHARLTLPFAEVEDCIGAGFRMAKTAPYFT